MRPLLAVTAGIGGQALAERWLGPVGWLVVILLIGLPCLAALAAWLHVQRNEDARSIERYRRGQSAFRAVAEPNPTTRRTI